MYITSFTGISSVKEAQSPPYLTEFISLPTMKSKQLTKNRLKGVSQRRKLYPFCRSCCESAWSLNIQNEACEHPVNLFSTCSMHCITLKIQLCVMVYMRGFHFVIKILFLSIYRRKSTVHRSQCNDADWANSAFLNHPCFVVTFPILQKKSFLSWELKLAVKEVNYDDEAYVMTTGIVLQLNSVLEQPKICDRSEFIYFKRSYKLSIRDKLHAFASTNNVDAFIGVCMKESLVDTVQDFVIVINRQMILMEFRCKQ
ncbi:hypothetical protein OUZ56_024981 [Daphnia magna]|uniref:Uncharacterized protein n=1 Tax=Daphnia magna TaxID=35525 RepID=A0ABQ9ZIL0_9CRUS|nr:hypothetical protein OUZ56_024981 [Daphnia magna]